MRQSAKRILSLIGSLVLLVAAIIIFSSFIRPTYAEVQEIKGELLSRRQVLETQQSAIEQVRQLVETYDGEGQLAQTISLALPQERQESHVIHTIGQLAEAEGLAVDSLSISSPGVQNVARARTTLINPTGTLQAQLRLSGEYVAFNQFLSRLETNLRLMDVRRITVSPAGDDANVFDFGVTVETYYQAD